MRPIHLLAAVATVFALASCQTTAPRPSTGSSTTLPSPGSFQRTGEIAIDLTTDKTSYRAGESILATVRVEDACHLRLFSQDSEGNISQLWPNKPAPDRPLKAGETLALGTPSSGFLLRATKPFGKELLWAIASSNPFPAGYTPGGNGTASWNNSSRGMIVETTSPAAKRGEAKRVISIEAAP